MPSTPSTPRKSSALRLRAGLLLLVVFIALSGMGGHWVARQFGLGLGWSLLLAVALWVGVGIVLARMGSKLYFATASAITAFFAYLAYDFARGALEWSFWVSLVVAGLAALFVVFTFYDFLKLKQELRVMVYGR